MTEPLNIGRIVIADDPILYATQFYEENNPQFFRLFCLNKLDIDTSRAIIDESYIASDGIKTIIIAANEFQKEAQNALLKVLEEPPKNIVFVVVAKIKSILLPTICSRLPIFKHNTKEKLPPFPVAIKDLSLQSIIQFLKLKDKEISEFEYSEIKSIKDEVQSLYLDSIAFGLEFSKDEISKFEKSILWDKQTSGKRYVLLPLLLMVLRKKKEGLLKQHIGG